MHKTDPSSSDVSRRPGPVEQLARRVLIRRLKALRGCSVELHEPSARLLFGDDGALRAGIRVRDPRFYRRVLFGGSLAVAASYIGGDWECDNLTSLFRIFARNESAANRLDRTPLWLSKLWNRLIHFRRANTRTGSRRNIGAHYDLGNDFFRLWLDETLAYSSGIFPSPESTLREASVEKFDRICRKLELGPHDHVLEIGTGWGGFAIHAASKYGCRVTTTTISRQQFELARERIRAAGLSQRVTVIQKDYRELSGRFDKLVSIEMIEAVGHRNFDLFFGQCDRLLKPDGSCVIQAIVIADQRYRAYLRSVDFIQRYVFPGGCLPSVGAMIESVGRSANLRFVHVEDFGGHYAETLRRWRQAFHAQLDEVRRLGYSEETIRLWDYYLCYCEAAFEEGYTSVVQMQFDKPQCRRDSVRLSTLAAAPGNLDWNFNESRESRPEEMACR